jgi:ABC-2 type transport system ATP-binding protein
MCDRVAIISHGNVIAVGNVTDLIRQSETKVEWRLSPYEKGLELLESSDGIVLIDEKKTDITEITLPEIIGEDTVHAIMCDMPADQIPIVNSKLTQANIKVYSITIKNPTLEDLFLRLTEGEKID